MEPTLSAQLKSIDDSIAQTDDKNRLKELEDLRFSVITHYAQRFDVVRHIIDGKTPLSEYTARIVTAVRLGIPQWNVDWRFDPKEILEEFSYELDGYKELFDVGLGQKKSTKKTTPDKTTPELYKIKILGSTTRTMYVRDSSTKIDGDMTLDDILPDTINRDVLTKKQYKGVMALLRIHENALTLEHQILKYRKSV